MFYSMLNPVPTYKKFHIIIITSGKRIAIRQLSWIVLEHMWYPWSCMLIMAVHIDLITCCHFSDDYGRNVELYMLPKTIFVKDHII